MAKITSIGQMSKEAAEVKVAEIVASKPKVEQPKVEVKTEEKPAEKIEQPAQPVAEKKEESAEKPAEPIQTKEKKTLKEIAKPYKKEAKAEEVKVDDIPEPLKLKLSQYEQKIADYEKKLNKSSYKLIDEAEKAGKKAIDIFNEIRKEDISKLSPDQLYERELIKSGVKYEGEAVEGEDTIENEMAKFKELPKIARDREINAIKKSYEDSNANLESEFLSKLTEENLKASQSENEKRKAAIAANDATEKAVIEACDDFVGKTHRGILITKEMSQSIKNRILQDGLVDKNPDGSLNAEQLRELAFYRVFGMDNELMWTELENQITATAVEKIEETVNVTGMAAKNSRVQQVTELSHDEKMKKIASSLRPVEIGNPSIAR